VFSRRYDHQTEAKTVSCNFLSQIGSKPQFCVAKLAAGWGDLARPAAILRCKIGGMPQPQARDYSDKHQPDCFAGIPIVSCRFTWRDFCTTLVLCFLIVFPGAWFRRAFAGQHPCFYWIKSSLSSN
jgi:hypothetical protein